MDSAPTGWSRRRYLSAAVATGTLSATAGCLDGLPFVGDDPLTFIAESATVPPAVLEATGYEEQSVSDLTVTETFEVAGQRQRVEAINRLAEYDRSIDLGPLSGLTGGDERAALFVVLSTPQVEVLGQTFNPVGDMNAEELLELVQDHYEGIDDPVPVGEQEVEVAGMTTTVGAFETTAELAVIGQRITLTLMVAEAVPIDGDFVVVIGGYPSAISGIEEDRFRTLAGAVVHGD